MSFLKKVDILIPSLDYVDTYDRMRFSEYLEFLVRISDFATSVSTGLEHKQVDVDYGSMPIHLKLNSVLPKFLALVKARPGKFRDNR